MRLWLCAIISCSILLAGLAGPAQAEDEGSEDQPIMSASQCPALFGGHEAHELSKKVRTEKLDEVIPGEHLINLVYFGDWQPPAPIRYKGFKLLAAGAQDAIGKHALLDIPEMPQGIDCPAGRYLLRQDHSLGNDTRVLAILDQVILLERGGQLRYLKTEKKARPDFRLIWRSTWTLAGVTPSSSGSSPSRPKSAGTKSHKSTRKPPSHRTKPRRR